MSNRLNQDREKKLQPLRVNKAITAIKELGIEITKTCPTYIQFIFKESTVTYFPYSGWASGKSIKDGRGLEPLLDQLKSK